MLVELLVLASGIGETGKSGQRMFILARYVVPVLDFW